MTSSLILNNNHKHRILLSSHATRSDICTTLPTCLDRVDNVESQPILLSTARCTSHIPAIGNVECDVLGIAKIKCAWNYKNKILSVELSILRYSCLKNNFAKTSVKVPYSPWYVLLQKNNMCPINEFTEVINNFHLILVTYI